MTASIQAMFLVNIGNSSIECGKGKAPLADGHVVITDAAHFDRVPQAMTEVDKWRSRQRPSDGRWFVTSVCTGGLRQFEKWAARHDSRVDLHLISHVDFDLQMNVEVPERVGTDRLAAAVAANRRRRSVAPAVVIDAGTAITIDLIDSNGVFQGGAIFPGLKLAAESLRWGTDQLPTVDVKHFDELPAYLGKDTIEAIQTGIYWGTVGAVRQVLNGIIAELNEPADVFLTGGGSGLIAKHLEIESCVAPTLVLEGMALAASKLCFR